MYAAASNEKSENIEDDVVSLLNYLIVLIKVYPHCITQKELAVLVSVTPGAVSKIKDKLFPFCDVKTLAYESKIVLKPDFDVLELVITQLAKEPKYPTIIYLLSTRYGEEVIATKGIYKIVAEKMPILLSIFDEEEIELGGKILLRYIRSFAESKDSVTKTEKVVEYLRSLNLLEAGGESFLFGLLMGNVIRKGLDWPIETEAELKTVICIRDKLFYLLENLCTEFTSGLSILDTLETEEQKTLFKTVYQQTTNFYLKKVFSIITSSLELSATKKNITFLEKYKKITENAATGA